MFWSCKDMYNTRMATPQTPVTVDISGYGPLLADRLNVRVLQCAKLQIDTFWRFDAVRSSFWRVYVNADPGAWLVLRQGELARFDLAPDRLVVVPPWLAFDCHCNGPVEHFYVHFDVLGMTRPWIERCLPRPHALELDPVMFQVVDRLRAELAHEEYPSLRPGLMLWLKTLAYAALSRVIDTLPDEDAREGLGMTEAASAMAPALVRIDSALGEALELDELAALCHLSVSQFNRRFREATGQAPARYIRERRVAVAADRLVRTDWTIEAIAQELGFVDRFHFSRVFKAVWGLPPAAYRKQQGLETKSGPTQADR